MVFAISTIRLLKMENGLSSGAPIAALVIQCLAQYATAALLTRLQCQCTFARVESRPLKQKATVRSALFEEKETQHEDEQIFRDRERYKEKEEGEVMGKWSRQGKGKGREIDTDMGRSMERKRERE